MRTSTLIIGLLIILTGLILIPSRIVTLNDNELIMSVWGMPFEDLLFRDEYARGFEQLNPGWHIRYQRHAQLIDKYNAWHVQKRGADVMRMGIDYYHQFVDKGMLYPLTDFISDPNTGLSENEIKDYFPTIWEQLITADKQIYALPSDNAQYGLYYNKTIFDQYNHNQPDPALKLDYPDSDWTWQDLQHAAVLLNIKDPDTGTTIQFGVMFDLWAWPFMAFIMQADGKLWDENGTTTLINSPAGIEAMEYLLSIIPDDAPVRVKGLSDSAESPAQLFKVGRLAILLDGSWRAPNIELDCPDLDFAIAPLPYYKKRAVVSGSVLWAISAHSQNPQKAWEMIKWITNRQQSIKYWDVLRVAPPARISVVTSDSFKYTTGITTSDGIIRVPAMTADKYPDRAAWLEYAITSTSSDPAAPQYPGFVATNLYQLDLQSKIKTALVNVISEDMPAKEALDKAARELHQIIDRDRAAKGLPAVKRN